MRWKIGVTLTAVGVLVLLLVFIATFANPWERGTYVFAWNRQTICTAIGAGAVLLALIIVLATWPLRRDARPRGNQPLGVDALQAPARRMTPPDGLGPAEASALLRGRPGVNDVAAMLADLARRGALTISLPADVGDAAGVDTGTRLNGPNWCFTKTAIAVPVTAAEQVLLDGLFEQATSISFRHLSRNLTKLTTRVNAQTLRDVTGRGWFKTSLVTASKAYRLLLVAVIAGAASLFGSPIAAGWTGQWFIATGGIVLALLLAIALFTRPGRTREGVAIYQQAKAYEWYLTLVGQNRASGPHDLEVAAAWAIAFDIADAFVHAAQPRSTTYAFRYPWWLFATTGVAQLRAAANPSRSSRSASAGSSGLPRSSSSSADEYSGGGAGTGAGNW